MTIPHLFKSDHSTVIVWFSYVSNEVLIILSCDGVIHKEINNYRASSIWDYLSQKVRGIHLHSPHCK